MKLSTFTKVNTAAVTEFTVWNGKIASDFVETFTVNYLEKDVEKLNKQIIKRMDYEKRGASVQFVSVYKEKLQVSLKI